MVQVSKLSCLAIGAVLLVSTLTARAADRPGHGGARKSEFPLKYRLAFVAVQEEAGHGGQYLEVETRKERAAGEPAYQSKEPQYVTTTLGAKKQKFQLVFDCSSGGNRGYDVLYFDTDGDGTFSPKEKFAGLARDQGFVFGPVKVMIDCHDDHPDKCPQWFLIQFTEYEYGDAKDLQVQRNVQLANAGYYEGKVRFGDKEMLLAFADGDGNGLYNSVMKRDGDGQHDRLLLDLNGDGKLDGAYQSDEALPLGRFVEVGGKYWQLDVAPDGASVAITPYDKPLGTIRSEIKDFTLLLAGDDGVLQVRSKSGTARVPALKYRLHQCNYQMSHEGKVWKFAGQCQGEAVAIDVPPDGEAKVVFGAPFVPKIAVNAGGPELTLSLQLRGAGGEIYHDVQMGDNYQRPPAPKVKVLDEQDKVLAQLDFHYG
jgi:hypothetical protein